MRNEFELQYKTARSRRLDIQSCQAHKERWLTLPGYARPLHRAMLSNDGIDGGWTRVSFGLDRQLRRVPTRLLRRAFLDTLQVSCECEHDCCGCVQEHVTNFFRPSRKTVSVILRWYPNV